MGFLGKNREILALFALVVFLGCDQRSSLRSSLIGLTDGGGEPPGNGGGGEPPSGRELPFSLIGVSRDQGVRPGLTQTDFNLDIPTAQYTSNRMGATQPSFSPDGLLMFSGDGSFSDGSRGLRVSIVDYRATSEVQGKLDFVTKTGLAANPRAFPMHRYLQLGTGGACGAGIYRRVPIGGCTNWRVTLDDPARADDGQATNTTYLWHVTTFLPNTGTDNPYISDVSGNRLTGSGPSNFRHYVIGIIGSVVTAPLAGDADAVPGHRMYTTAERDRAFSCIGDVVVEMNTESGFQVPSRIVSAGLRSNTCSVLELTTSTQADPRVVRGIEFSATYGGDIVVGHSRYYPPALHRPSDGQPGTGHVMVWFRQRGSLMNPTCAVPEAGCVTAQFSIPQPIGELYQKRNTLIPPRNSDVPAVTYGDAYPLTRNPISTPNGDKTFSMSNPELERNLQFAYPWITHEGETMTGISRAASAIGLRFTAATQVFQRWGGLKNCLFSNICYDAGFTGVIAREGFDTISARHVVKLPGGGLGYPVIASDSPISEHRTLYARVTSGSFFFDGPWSPIHRLPISHFAQYRMFPGSGAINAFVNANNSGAGVLPAFLGTPAPPNPSMPGTLSSQFDMGANRAGYLFFSSLAPGGNFFQISATMPGIETNFGEALDLSRNRMRFALTGAYYTYNDPITNYNAAPWFDHARGFQNGRVGEGVSFDASGKVSISERTGVSVAGTLTNYSKVLSVVGWFKALSNQALVLAQGPAYTLSLRGDRKLELTVRVENSAGSPFVRTVVSGQTVLTSEWFHVIASMQVTPTREIETRFYLNGTYSHFDRSPVLSTATDLVKTGSEWFFGPGGASAGTALVLQADEIGVVARSLSAVERRALAMIPDPEPKKNETQQRNLLGPLAAVLDLIELDVMRAYVPTDNPITNEKVLLGSALFNDPNLSSTRTVSCATCHEAALGFSSSAPLGKPLGVTGVATRRTTPSLINLVFANPEKGFFADGRATESLENQVLHPLLDPLEMGMTDNTMIVDRVKAQSTYTGLVQEAFGVSLNQLTLGQIQKALATFMRAIVAGNSPYDAYQRGDSSALTSVQLKGVGIFNRRCIGCHNGPMLTDRDFHNIGLRSNTHTDFGRQNASNNALDRWAFMTSGLRDLQLRQDKLGFDGKTLTEILSNYQVGGLHRGQGEVAETLSPKMQASDLSSEETEALRQFLLFGLQSTFRTF